MKNKIIGSVIFIIAFIFQIKQTEYFGNHFFPQTIQEFLFDLVAIVVLTLGFYIMNKGFRKNTSNKCVLYVITILHIPFTLIRLVIALFINLDLWCDKVIDKAISEVSE